MSHAETLYFLPINLLSTIHKISIILISIPKYADLNEIDCWIGKRGIYEEDTAVQGRQGVEIRLAMHAVASIAC